METVISSLPSKSNAAECYSIVNVGNKTQQDPQYLVTDTVTTTNKSQIFSCHIKVVVDIEKHPGHSLLFKNCGCYSICSSETGGPRQLDPGEPRKLLPLELSQKQQRRSPSATTHCRAHSNNRRVTRTPGRGNLTGKGTLSEV